MSGRRPRLSIVSGEIVYELDDGPAWALPLDRLAVLGEQTDASGPGSDYFLVLVTPEGDQYVASFYSDGRDEVLGRLEAALAAEIRCGLLWSADLRSRVMWPPQLVGERLYDIVPVEPASLVARVIGRLFPSFELRLTAAVLDVLQETGGGGPS